MFHKAWQHRRQIASHNYGGYLQVWRFDKLIEVIGVSMRESPKDRIQAKGFFILFFFTF